MVYILISECYFCSNVKYILIQPATVSRCGMIYMEPSQLGWQPIAASWINVAPEVWSAEHKATVQALCEWIIPSTTRFIRKCCKVRLSSF